jgi:HEAT repeat protein
VTKFAHDRHPAVAKAALRHLIRSHHDGLVALLMKLVNAGHDEVRQLAGRHLAPIGFARLWEQWPNMAPDQRLAAGRALIKIDPDLHRHLGEKLELRDQQTRLRALSMIAHLNQGEFFEQALDRLARDSDEKVASAAVRALGTAASESAAGTLMTSLDHGDARVRANAVEALERLQSTQHIHRLVEMAEEDEHRPRVSAIKALMQMKTSDALHALSKMLRDKRSMHRVSALWLVESMGLLEVARQVAEMSLSDPDKKVKGRADHVIHGLIDTMNQAPPGDQWTNDPSSAA